MKLNILLLLLAFSVGRITGQSAKPNVIIILADDMGYGDVKAFNKLARTSTPHIDALTKRGISFTDAHSGGAVCTPSRYGILTGRYYFRNPDHNGYLGYLKPLINKERVTIGSLMQSAGYKTAAIGKWHLGLEWGLKDENQPQIPTKQPKTITNTDFSKPVDAGPNAIGFDYSYILPASLDMPPYTFVHNKKVVDPNVILTADAYPHQEDSTKTAWDRKYTNANDVYWERGVWWRNGEMSRSFRMEDCLDTIVQQGLSFISDHVKSKPDQPFMLYLPLTGPHTPWMVNKEFSGKTGMGIYSDFVAQIDDAVGRVNQLLQQLSITENTIVIFSSDNGSPWVEEDIQLYNHESNFGHRGQKGDIYDGGHHIPLIIQWPAKIKRPATYNHTLSLVDILATLAELTSQRLSKGSAEDSFSFYKVLASYNQLPTRKSIIYESSRGKLAIKEGNWKYIDALGSGGFTEPALIQPLPGGATGQLYDLKADPMEQHDLALQFPEIVRSLKARLDQQVTQGYTALH